MRIPAILIASVVVLALLPGCKSAATSCKQDNKDYVGAKELPPLNTPERVRGKNEPCLDVPPPFTAPKAADAEKPK